MKKLLKFLKKLYIIILATIIGLCALGFGSIIVGYPIIYFLKLNGDTMWMVIFLSTFMPMPICSFLSVLINDKYF